MPQDNSALAHKVIGFGLAAWMLGAGCYQSHLRSPRDDGGASELDAETFDAQLGVEAGVVDGAVDAGDGAPPSECPGDLGGTWTLEWVPDGWSHGTSMDFDATGLPVHLAELCLAPGCTPDNCEITLPSPPECTASARWRGPCSAPRGDRNEVSYRYWTSTRMEGVVSLENDRGTLLSRFVAHR